MRRVREAIVSVEKRSVLHINLCVYARVGGCMHVGVQARGRALVRASV